jgi:hypothetical protein
MGYGAVFWVRGGMTLGTLGCKVGFGCGYCAIEVEVDWGWIRGEGRNWIRAGGKKGKLVRIARNQGD